MKSDEADDIEEILQENKDLLEVHNIIHQEINLFREQLTFFLDNIRLDISNLLDANESRCLDNEEDKNILLDNILFTIKNEPIFRNLSTNSAHDSDDTSE